MPQLRFKDVLKRDLVAYRIAVELLRQNDLTAGSVELKRKVTAQQSQSGRLRAASCPSHFQRWKRTPSFLDFVIRWQGVCLFQWQYSWNI